MFVMCPLLLGWTMFQSGQASEGLQRMEDAVAATRQSVRRFYYEYELLVFAEALLKAGELDRAQQVVQEALDRITTSSELPVRGGSASPVGRVPRDSRQRPDRGGRGAAVKGDRDG